MNLNETENNICLGINSPLEQDCVSKSFKPLDKGENMKGILDKIFEECNEILKDRKNSYEDSNISDKDTLDYTSLMWSEYLNHEFSRANVCMMMAFLKLAREMVKPKKDNILDAINYLALYEKEVILDDSRRRS